MQYGILFDLIFGFLARFVVAVWMNLLRLLVRAFSFNDKQKKTNVPSVSVNHDLTPRAWNKFHCLLLVYSIFVHFWSGFFYISAILNGNVVLDWKISFFTLYFLRSLVSSIVIQWKLLAEKETMISTSFDFLNTIFLWPNQIYANTFSAGSVQNSV